MILPLFDWLERRDWLNRRTLNGEPAHRFWWWHIGLAFKGEHYRGRPRARTLMVGEGIIYPLVWAGWLAFCLLGAVLTVAIRSLSGLPDAGVAVLEGLAGPGYFPVLTRRWALGWWVKYDPHDPDDEPVALGDETCPNCRNEVDPTWDHCPGALGIRW